MKKQSLFACLPLLIFSAALLGGCGGEKPPIGIPGGENPVPVTYQYVVEAANFAVKAQESAMQKTNETQTANVRLLSVTSAKAQVSVDYNFRLMLKVKFNGQERNAEALVVVRSSTAETKELTYELTSWNWQ